VKKRGDNKSVFQREVGGGGRPVREMSGFYSAEEKFSFALFFLILVFTAITARKNIAL
jgi:hypothetical protein